MTAVRPADGQDLSVRIASSQASTANVRSYVSSNSVRARRPMSSAVRRSPARLTIARAKRGAVTFRHDQPGTRRAEDPSDLALGVADEDRRPAGSGNAVVLARHNEAFEARAQRDEMHIRHREALRQAVARLIGLEPHVAIAALFDLRLQRRQLRAATDEQPFNCGIRMAPASGTSVVDAAIGSGDSPRCLRQRDRRKDRLGVMRPAEIAGVADDECVREPPFAAQLVVAGRNGPDKTPIRPIRNDADSIRRGTSAGAARRPCARRSRHSATPSAAPDRAATQDRERNAAEPAAAGHAERRRHFGIDVLKPVDGMGAAQPDDRRRHDRKQVADRSWRRPCRRGAPAAAAATPPPDRTSDNRRRARARPVRPKPVVASRMISTPRTVSRRRQSRHRVVVGQPRRDDRDPVPAIRKCEGEVREHLAGRRMIRIEIAIDEKDAHPATVSHARCSAPGTSGRSPRCRPRAGSTRASRATVSSDTSSSLRGVPSGLEVSCAKRPSKPTTRAQIVASSLIETSSPTPTLTCSSRRRSSSDAPAHRRGRRHAGTRAAACRCPTGRRSARARSWPRASCGSGPAARGSRRDRNCRRAHRGWSASPR